MSVPTRPPDIQTFLDLLDRAAAADDPIDGARLDGDALHMLPAVARAVRIERQAKLVAAREADPELTYKDLGEKLGLSWSQARDATLGKTRTGNAGYGRVVSSEPAAVEA